MSLRSNDLEGGTKITSADYTFFQHLGSTAVRHALRAAHIRKGCNPAADRMSLRTLADKAERALQTLYMRRYLRSFVIARVCPGFPEWCLLGRVRLSYSVVWRDRTQARMFVLFSGFKRHNIRRSMRIACSLSCSRESLLGVVLNAGDDEHVFANARFFDDLKASLVTPDCKKLDDAERVLEHEAHDVARTFRGLNVLRAALVQKQADELVYLREKVEE